MKKIYYIALSLIICASCSKWLDVKPYDKMAEDELLSSESGFRKHLNTVRITGGRALVKHGTRHIRSF